MKKTVKARKQRAFLRIRYAIEFYGLLLATALVRRLPYNTLRPLAHFLGSLVYPLDIRGRKVALDNLSSVFRDTKSSEEQNRIARESYRTFARTMLELLWAPSVNARTLGTRIHIHGLDDHPCHKDPKQPVIYFCLHYSNFEWLSLVGPYLVGKAFVVTQRFKNPRLGQIFDKLRGSTGHDVLTQENAFIRMFKHLKKGGKFFMLTDLTLDPREASVVIDCFGKKTSVTQLHAAMARRTGALMVPVECQPAPDGSYRVQVHAPIEPQENESESELVQQAWDALASSILKDPTQWVWSYKH